MKLTEAACASDEQAQIGVGRAIHAFLHGDPPHLLRRREAVSLAGRNLNVRRVRVEVDLESAKLRAPGFELDSCPIAMLPKAVLHDFKVMQGGDPLTLLPRGTQAALACCHLIMLAVEHLRLPYPTVKVADLLHNCVERFPLDDNDARNFRARALSRGDALAGSDGDWWRQASSSPEWAWWLIRYEENHLLCPFLTDAQESRSVYEYEYVESRQVVGPNRFRAYLTKTSPPIKIVAIALNDIGRARSEHLTIEAPPGTFFDGGRLNRRGVADFWYRVKPTRTHLTFYVRRVEARNATLIAAILPEPRGFILPLRVLAWYGFAICMAAMFGQFETGIDNLLKGNLGPALALAFLIPTSLVGTLFRSEASDIRWSVLRPWRVASLLTVGCLWLAAGLLFAGYAGLPKNAHGILFAVVVLGQYVALMVTERLVRRLHDGSARAANNESLPAKGRFVRIVKGSESSKP